MSETVFLKVTSAFLVDGEIAKAGEIVEVTAAEAKDLLNRGKAEIASEKDIPAQTAEEKEPPAGDDNPPADTDPQDPVTEPEQAQQDAKASAKVSAKATK